MCSISIYFSKLFGGWTMTENIRKVLIVDDEYFIGKLIYKLVDWDSKSLECADILDNGKDAIDYIKSNTPDIVITDIRMPGVSGLDLIRETRGISNKIQYIIISGYREFEYAREAMKYGIDHYVLKPINKDDLREALDDVINILGEIENKEAREKRLIETVENSKKIIKSSILKDIIENNDYDNTIFLNKDSRLFRAINIKLDYEDIDQVYKRQDSITVAKVVDIVNKILEVNVGEVIGCNKEFMNIFFLFNYSIEDAKSIGSILNTILSKINEYLIGFERYRATVGVGSEKSKLNDIKISINEARYTIEKRLRIGINRVIYFEDLNRVNSSNEYVDIMNEYNDELKKGMESFDIEKIKYILSEIFRKISDGQNEDIVYQIYDRIYGLFKDYSDEKIEEEYRDALSLLNSCCNLSDCKKVILKYVLDCLEYIKSKSEGRVLKPIRTMISYIKDNYREKITIEDMAEIVDLNPIYLGSLFKKEIGLNFSSYLIKVRIDAAKSLLIETNYTIAAIGSEVGYKDTRYFSQLFEKTVGIKPALYRKIHS